MSLSIKYLTSIQKAADLNINPLAYRKLAQQQIHYALGDTGRSYVVGYGVNPPLKPHHASRFEWQILVIKIILIIAYNQLLDYNFVIFYVVHVRIDQLFVIGALIH